MDGVPEIEAAGGVVWRPAVGGVEVLLVHRPKYDDWSLPKGKLDPGETPEDAAHREVFEETGLRVERGAPLPEARYLDRHDRPKRVRYWAMRALDGQFTPHDEVDEIRWLAPDDAAAQLSYPRDRDVVWAFVSSRASPPS